MTIVSTRKLFSECMHLLKRVRRTQGNRIKIIKYIDWEDVEEPCKGDTPA